LLVAGLEAALEFALAFRYIEQELKFLAQVRDYDAAFLNDLGQLRFTGEILALQKQRCLSQRATLTCHRSVSRAILLEAGLLQAIGLSHSLQRRHLVSSMLLSRVTTTRRRIRLPACPGADDGSSCLLYRWLLSTSLLNAAYEYRLPATGTVPHALIEMFPTEEMPLKLLRSI